MFSTSGTLYREPEWLMILTGWLFIIASIAAWYTGSALMLEEAFGREIWSLGKSK